MNKILNIFVLIIFWTILLVPLYFISKKLDIGATAFIAALYLVLLFISISYKHFWSLQTFNNRKGIIKFFSVVFASFLALLYITNLVYGAHTAYKHSVVENSLDLDGIAYQADDTLGLKPIPNARTLYHYDYHNDVREEIPRPKIPIAFDNNGFRIPLSNISKVNESNKINLLFLGDSFTFGDACLAEETFPFLVSKESNLSYINAGFQGGGLAHMLIFAEKLIPQYKPDYVIVQYTNWLVQRGTSMFAPYGFCRIPFPYFAEQNNGYVLELPAYNSYVKFIDPQHIKSLYKGKFIKFLFKEALLSSLYDGWYLLKTEFLLITGQLPRPATNLWDVEMYAYSRIKTIAEENGATVIILNLGNIEYSKYSHSLFSDPNIYFAEADSSLNDFLKTSPSKDYCMEFCHWIVKGKDMILIDRHPNPKAHRIIASSIIKEINKTKKI